MPNYCDFEMKVSGYKDNVDEFIKILQADYNYSIPYFTHDRHFFRVFEAIVNYYNTYGLHTEAIISGYCAWSVFCCMFPGKLSYYDEHLSTQEMTKFSRKSGFTNYPISEADKHGTNILVEAYRLQLNIEIYSAEPGMCFSEHYRIDKGIKTLDETTEYICTFCDDFESYEKCKEYYAEDNITITKDMWDYAMEYNYGCIDIGGYMQNGEYNYKDSTLLGNSIMAKKINKG